MIFDIFAG